MANEKSIVEALSALERAVSEANCLGETLTIDQNSPPWAYLFYYQSERIQQAAEALERLVRREVLPLIRDLDSLTRGASK